MTSSTSRDIPEMGEPTPCTVRNLQLTLFLHFRIVFFLFKVNESYKILPSQHKLLHKVGAKKARTFLEKKKKNRSNKTICGGGQLHKHQPEITVPSVST